MREELLKIAYRLETQGALGLSRAIESLRALAERAPAGESVDAVREWLRKSGCPDHLLDGVARNYTAPPSQPAVVYVGYIGKPLQTVALPSDLAAALADLHAAMGTPATQGSVGDSPYVGVVKLAAKRLAEQPVADRSPSAHCLPDGWREFIAECATFAGKQVNGNRLSAEAAKLLAAAPAGEGVGCGHESCDCRSYCKKAAPEVPRG